ncbi:MAG TPA: histidine phosphatase family protein [Candidatus Saccharimonadales bacterium]|nr:histidine phosphatase family protein [Candidatus Saccharimonadales bacterium]
MPIYFVRHGECEANEKMLLAGQRDDSPLTDVGRRQAAQAATDLNKIHIDYIISSPLMRTRETAVIIAETVGVDKRRVTIDDRINEYDLGDYTRMPVDMPPPDWNNVPHGESVRQFRDRVLSFFRQYKNNPENILVVSHAGVGRIIDACRQELEPEAFYELDPYPNGRVIQLDLDWLT